MNVNQSTLTGESNPVHRINDAGTLDRARELEAIGFLQIKLASSEEISWNNGFALID